MLEMVLDNVLILPDKKEVETTTLSGLILQASAEKPVDKGTVIAVGDGTYQAGTWIKTHVKVGDRVVFRPFTGYEIEEDGQTMYVFKEPDLIAVIR